MFTLPHFLYGVSCLFLCSLDAPSFTSAFVPVFPSRYRRSLLFTAHTATANYHPVDLTVVIPAYNEVDRIGDTLQSYTDYFRTNASQLPFLRQCKILVVDDGSLDATAELARTYPGVECVSLPSNQGKGAAVSHGIVQLKPGELCLVADADGSATLQDLPAMLMQLVQTMESSTTDTQPPLNSSFWLMPAMVVGHRISTAGDGGGDESTMRLSSSSLPSIRSILRWGFRTTVRCFAGDLRVRDTQCGFKLMTVTAGQLLYRNLNLQGWTHDVEVLYRAKMLEIPVAEHDIQWQDKEGSKLIESPGGTIGVSITMLLEVLLMRLAYETGSWTVPR